MCLFFSFAILLPLSSLSRWCASAISAFGAHRVFLMKPRNASSPPFTCPMKTRAMRSLSWVRISKSPPPARHRKGGPGRRNYPQYFSWRPGCCVAAIVSWRSRFSCGQRTRSGRTRQRTVGDNLGRNVSCFLDIHIFVRRCR